MSTSIQSLQNLIKFYANLRVEKIYVKILAPNDNSKNQVYFGPGFEALNLFPTGEIFSDPSQQNAIFKSSLDYCWIGDDLSLVDAPTAQIVLYPQYPEIRFSGFLKGAERAKIDSARALMTSRAIGRVIFLGVSPNGKIIGSVFDPESSVAKELQHTIFEGLTKATEIFFEIITSVFLGNSESPKITLLKELCRIHRLDWINSRRLDSQGNTLPCSAPQCGGYTLEAALGITPNGRSEPDFQGWEVKQHSGSVLTLMTPEPTGGFYVEQGVESFIRTYGYLDQRGRENRMNFGGTHFCNTRHALTGLTLKLDGYDKSTGKITNANGGIALTADDGTITAFWAFSGVLKHWNRKHNNAVYVSSENRKFPENQYRFGNIVKLGEGTDPLYLLKAIETGKVYYDPGIKLEEINTAKPKAKKRSQFRVKLKDLNGLYFKITDEDVSVYCQ